MVVAVGSISEHYWSDFDEFWYTCSTVRLVVKFHFCVNVSCVSPTLYEVPIKLSCYKILIIGQNVATSHEIYRMSQKSEHIIIRNINIVCIQFWDIFYIPLRSMQIIPDIILCGM
jgi:hypothetical protein